MDQPDPDVVEVPSLEAVTAHDEDRRSPLPPSPRPPPIITIADDKGLETIAEASEEGEPSSPVDSPPGFSSQKQIDEVGPSNV